jgi:hypothetical protein
VYASLHRVTNHADFSPKSVDSGIWKVFGDLGIFRGFSVNFSVKEGLIVNVEW